VGVIGLQCQQDAQHYGVGKVVLYAKLEPAVRPACQNLTPILHYTHQATSQDPLEYMSTTMHEPVCMNRHPRPVLQHNPV